MSLVILTFSWLRKKVTLYLLESNIFKFFGYKIENKQKHFEFRMCQFRELKINIIDF